MDFEHYALARQFALESRIGTRIRQMKAEEEATAKRSRKFAQK